jgi:hypothetical protein
MHPAYEDDTDHGDRLTRLEGHDREVASQIAAQTIQIHALTDKMGDIADRFTAGLDRLGQQLTTMTATLQQHGAHLQSLGEARERQRSMARWIGGSSARWWWRRW